MNWTPLAVSRLRSLRMEGVGRAGCADIIGTEFGATIGYGQLDSALKRYGLVQIVEKDGRATRYAPMTLPMDDYVIFSDVHAPFHSEEWINRLLFMARRFGVKKAVAVGDLLDCSFASKWYSDDKPSLDAEQSMVKPVFEALDYFDHIWWGRGNHEQRIGMMTDGVIQLKHLGQLFSGELWKKKITYSKYDKFFVGQDWMLVHPRSYRQGVVSVARDAASKYHRNIINTHGHFVGMGYDKSAKFLCIDLGGLFDTEKVDYYNLDTTTHPAWGNGFGILKDGKFWHFTEATDWDYWMGGKA